jgi:hypothetical protein
VLILDAAGDRSEGEFTLTSSHDIAELDFPSLSLEPDGLRLSSDAAEVTLRIVNTAGQLVGEHRLSQERYVYSELLENPNRRHEFFLYELLEDNGPWLLSGPYSQ